MNATAVAPQRRQGEHTFFLGMAVSLAVVVFAGFAPTFFLRPWFPGAIQRAAPERIFYLHGVLFAAWMMILIAQTALVRARHIRQHRRLGWASAVLAGLMVVVGILGCVVAARRPGGFMGDPDPMLPLEFLAVPFFDMVLFGLFVGLAVIWRRDAQSHKRLMLLATVNIVEPAVFRLLPASLLAIGGLLLNFWLADIFVVALVMWDVRAMRRLHPVTLWGSLLTVISQPLRFWIAETDPWHAFAGWLVGVVG